MGTLQITIDKDKGDEKSISYSEQELTGLRQETIKNLVFYAIRNNNLEALKLLHKACNQDSLKDFTKFRYGTGYNLLMVAASTSKNNQESLVGIVEYLVKEAGFASQEHLNHTNKAKNSAVEKAFKEGHYDVADYLLKQEGIRITEAGWDKISQNSEGEIKKLKEEEEVEQYSLSLARLLFKVEKKNKAEINISEKDGTITVRRTDIQAKAIIPNTIKNKEMIEALRGEFKDTFTYTEISRGEPILWSRHRTVTDEGPGKGPLQTTKL